ncbi:DUF697 domain-containing protein [Candidatus Latescibacterota bacterium]
MKKQLRNFIFAASFIFLLFFVMFVFNQTTNVVMTAREFNPLLGTILLFGLLILYALILLSPVIIFFKMPKTLRPPENINSPEYNTYIEQLKTHLKRNKYLEDLGISPITTADIENAVVYLDTEADKFTKSAASTIFVTTAISQNGRLDTIMVLIAQIRLIWAIAHVYNQRPSIRDMFDLYVNVAGTTFIVGSIEELDIEEQIEPIITPLISGSVFGGIPGASGVATFMTTSVVDGAANALLTLRVGIITRRCFGITHISNRKELRRLASLEAGKMLAPIVVKSAGYVSEAILKASKKRAGTVGVSIKDAAAKSASTVTNKTKKSAHAVIDYFKKPKK